MIDNISSKFPARSTFGLPCPTRSTSIASCSTHVVGSVSETNKDGAHATAILFGFAVSELPQGMLVGELNFHAIENYLDGKSKIDGMPNIGNTRRKHQINK